MISILLRRSGVGALFTGFPPCRIRRLLRTTPQCQSVRTQSQHSDRRASRGTGHAFLGGNWCVENWCGESWCGVSRAIGYISGTQLLIGNSLLRIPGDRAGKTAGGTYSHAKPPVMANAFDEKLHAQITIDARPLSVIRTNGGCR